MPIGIKIKRKKDSDNQKKLPIICNATHTDIEVYDEETGIDLTKNIRAIDIHLACDDISTAELDVTVGEVEIDGIKVVPKKQSKTVHILDVEVNPMMDTEAKKKLLQETKELANLIEKTIEDIQNARKDSFLRWPETMLFILLLGIGISFGFGWNPFESLINLILGV